MKNIAIRLAAGAATLSATAGPLFAQSSWWNWLTGGGSGGGSGSGSGGSTGGGTTTPVAVPEIDASAGLLAIAAVLAVMAFVWERRRRSA